MATEGWTRLEGRFDEFKERLMDRLGDMNTRMVGIETKVETTSQKIDQVDRTIIDFRGKFEGASWAFGLVGGILGLVIAVASVVIALNSMPKIT